MDKDKDKLDFTAINAGLGLKPPKIKHQNEKLITQLPVKVQLNTQDAAVDTIPAAPFLKKAFTSGKLKPRSKAQPRLRPNYTFLTRFFKTFVAFTFDHLMILATFVSLCLAGAWQLKTLSIPGYLKLLNNPNILILHVALAGVVYVFYFAYFKQFKTPSLGRQIVRYA